MINKFPESTQPGLTEAVLKARSIASADRGLDKTIQE
jgi:hypothetical protein